MKIIKCQDCNGTGLKSGLCDDHMCSNPSGCSFSGPDYPCYVCDGKGEGPADEFKRYWAKRYYSPAKKKADRDKLRAKKLKEKKEELKWLASEATRMEREAARIRLKLLRNKDSRKVEE